MAELNELNCRFYVGCYIGSLFFTVTKHKSPVYFHKHSTHPLGATDKFPPFGLSSPHFAVSSPHSLGATDRFPPFTGGHWSVPPIRRGALTSSPHPVAWMGGTCQYLTTDGGNLLVPPSGWGELTSEWGELTSAPQWMGGTYQWMGGTYKCPPVAGGNLSVNGGNLSVPPSGWGELAGTRHLND